MEQQKQDKIWAFLIHLSFNMWEEYVHPRMSIRGFRHYLRLDEPLWHDAVQAMSQNGVNMAVIDLGDAVKYESHPEIAVRNAWSTAKLREELKKMRALGVEPVPKLNFATSHDTWLGEYSRMISSRKYYEVCADLIRETCELFDKPRFFHLGMDEETMGNQKFFRHVVVRKNEAWWKDFFYLAGEVEKHGSRAWIWPDSMLWHYPEQFYKRMPKSVVMSNWYYRDFDNPESERYRKRMNAYIDLGQAGYEQMPTGAYFPLKILDRVQPPISRATTEANIGATVDFFKKKNLDDKRLLGFLQTWWLPTLEEYRDGLLEAIRLLGKAKKHY